MASATEATEWPSTAIAPEVKQLISLFFHLVDQPDDNVGNRLASEVFTPDGKLLTVQGAAVGSEGQVIRPSSFPIFTICHPTTSHFQSHPCVFESKAHGLTAISKSRASAWKTIKSRHHEVIKVYASDAAGSDVLLIGKLTAGLTDGSTTKTEFVARVIVDRTAAAGVGAPRMKLYQVWTGPSMTSKCSSSSCVFFRFCAPC